MIDHYPYAPPSVVSPLKITYSDNAKKASAHVIRDIVFSWEKLRLLFNLILLVPAAFCALANMTTHGMSPVKSATSVLTFVLLFNCLYLSLPILETYLCALTRKTAMPTLRRVLFTSAVITSSAGLFMIGYQTITQ